ncbi:MAG TPA: right-handed parallel beta-helix repeat-containing protein, partial [Gemmataceae bacterium]|nr:right-handed parallel beta-helix repeat-containing protein [Gemmataceae bacterium]
SQNPSFPLKTIKKGISFAVGGDTVIVKPGTYMEAVESKRDGTATSPIILQSSAVGGAVIVPPTGSNGFFVSHNYHTIDGFTVKQAVTGMKLGAHDGGNGPVVGLLIQNNTVRDSSSNGIQVTNGLNVEIAFNTVFNSTLNGISYSGNASLIHDNQVYNNGQFGIYVKDGVDHQVYNNNAHDNVQANLQIVGSLLASAKTYYVGQAIGNDNNTEDQAQAPGSPWQTIKKAVSVAKAGDSIIVLAGTYTESVESKFDASAAKPITIKAAQPGQVVVDPPAGGAGFFVSHNYHVIDGFVVTGSSVNGIQVSPPTGTTTISGVVVTNNQVSGNGTVGIKFTGVLNGVVSHNVVHDNVKSGIFYSGGGGSIFNNLVYSNALGSSSANDYAIVMSDCTACPNTGHTVANNTVAYNNVGGIRLGTNSTPSVSVTAQNNIVIGNPIGIKEPGNCCTGQVVDYNDVFGNTTANYQLSTSVVGAHSLSQAPGFVNPDPANIDFRLARVATGQAADSPCIDKGSATSDGAGLASRTAFTDKSPDTGQVDLGYHGTLIYPAQGAATVKTPTSMTFNTGQGNDTFTLSVNLAPGTGSDGISPGTDYAEVSFGSFTYSLPSAGFQQQSGNVWTYSGAGQLSTGTFTKKADGSVDVTVTATGLNLAYSDSPIAVGVRIGDDFGSSQVVLQGTIQFSP